MITFRRRPVEVTQSLRPGTVLVGRPSRRPLGPALIGPVRLHAEYVVAVQQRNRLGSRRPWTKVSMANGTTRWVHVPALELDQALDMAMARLIASSPQPVRSVG